MSELVITSAANARVKALVALRRHRERASRGVTVLEGYDELALALSVGAVPRELYYAPDLVADHARLDLVDRVRASGAVVVRMSRSAFEKAAYREGPDGFLAVVAAAGGRCPDLRLPADPLVVVAESVEKPGNLGAILRTADATGASAVVAADPLTDWGNPNLVRASKGTVFALPVASGSVDEVLGWLRRTAVTLVAATPDGTQDYADVDYRGPVAVAVGAERDGLSDELLAAADLRVRIPMRGSVNSLNVSVSAAVILYEAVRQRRLAAR